MAIKIECSKCGYQNDLGRVFCAQCGVKLDLRATSSRELQERRETDHSNWVKWLVALSIVLTLLLIAAAALWPQHAPAVLLEKSGAIQIPMKAKAARAAISYNQTVKLSLSEAEINGFLEERGKSRRMEGLAMDLKTGGFDLYAAQAWRPPANLTGLARFKLPYTLGMSGSFRNGVLTVEGARLGHLPLPGFARQAVVGFFAELFDDITREKRVVSALKTVAIDETSADLVLGP